MRTFTKSIILGSAVAVGLGIIGYLLVAFYQILILDMTDSAQMVDSTRSREAMYWSLPYTFIILVLANVLATRKHSSKHYFIGLVIILLTSLSITVGPLKIISIHMNYLPILLGGLVGSFIGAKLNKRLQSDLRSLSPSVQKTAEKAPLTSGS
jgi:hypothetical protein